MPNTMARRVRSFLGSFSLLGACLSVLALSAAVNILQAARLRALTAVPPDAIVGTQLPDIQITTDNGERVTLAFEGDETDTILYYYSDSCRWCQRNRANIRALRDAVRGRYRFVAIRSDAQSTAAIETVGPNADLSGSVSPDTRSAIGLRGTPHMLVVSSQRVVLQSWRGAFRGALLKRVQRYFGVLLPGLTAGPSSGD